MSDILCSVSGYGHIVRTRILIHIQDKVLDLISINVEKLMLNCRNLIQSHLEVIYMNQVLGDQNRRRTDYLMELQALRGIVPICSNCKSIRAGQNKWYPVEDYLIKNPEAEFSHSICPDCLRKLYPEEADEILGDLEKN